MLPVTAVHPISDEKRGRGVLLHRGVDRHVAGQGDESEQAGDRIDGQGEGRNGEQPHENAEGQRPRGLEPAIGQRAIRGARHQTIAIPLEVAVQCVGSADDHSRRQEHDRHRADIEVAWREPHATGSRHENHHRDPRLGQRD
jgi:hypothetical protein